MSIALRGRAKGGLLRMFKWKSQDRARLPAQRQLSAQDIVRLFRNRRQGPQDDRPTQLNDSEKQDRQVLSLLRGALYSRD